MVSHVGPQSGVVRLDSRTGDLVWQIGEEQLTAAAPEAGLELDSGGFRTDGRYVTASSTHVFSLDAASGEVLSAVPWPEPLAYGSDLLAVWPDGRVSRDDPQKPGDGIVFDPARPARGLAHTDGVVLAVAPDASRALVSRDTETGSDYRVVDGRTLEDLTKAVGLPEFSTRCGLQR